MFLRISRSLVFNCDCQPIRPRVKTHRWFIMNGSAGDRAAAAKTRSANLKSSIRHYWAFKPAFFVFVFRCLLSIRYLSNRYWMADWRSGRTQRWRSVENRTWGVVFRFSHNRAYAAFLWMIAMVVSLVCEYFFKLSGSKR